MMQIILECSDCEFCGDNIPNEKTEMVLRDSDQNENVNFYEDLDDLRSQLGI